MITGPRYKLAKRLGASVFEKTQTQKFAMAKERTEKNKKRGKGRGRQSEYGKQILEKQKVRVTYGVTERQFRNYVRKALAATGGEHSPLERLHELLEMRLDNVIWRMGLVSTRRAARQMVAHGHIMINGKKIRVPSYNVELTDTISVREGSKSHGSFAALADRFSERPMPSWLKWNLASMSGQLAQVPTSASAESAGDLAAVLSFYTR